LPFSSRVSREILCSCSEALFSPVSLMAILPVPFLLLRVTVGGHCQFNAHLADWVA